MGHPGRSTPQLANKDDLHDLLKKHGGVVRAVARELGVCHQTVWDYITGYPETEAFLEATREQEIKENCQMHEDTIRFMAQNKAIIPGHALNAAKFYLTAHDGRYKVHKKEEAKEEVKQFVKEVLHDILGNNNNDNVLDITAESDIQGKASQ